MMHATAAVPPQNSNSLLHFSKFLINANSAVLTNYILKKRNSRYFD